MSLNDCLKEALKLEEDKSVLSITKAKDNVEWVILYEPSGSASSEYMSYINLFSTKHNTHFKLNFLRKGPKHLYIADLDVPIEPLDFTKNGYGTLMMSEFMKKVAIEKINKVSGSLDYKNSAHLEKLHKFYNNFGLTTDRARKTIDWNK